jgi:hypothetical protein
MTNARSNVLTMDAYQDIPAMSAGMAQNMVWRCPLYAWHKSPFNPNFRPERKRTYDLGTAIHLALLEPELAEERIVVVPFGDYKTNAAKAMRDDAYSKGLVPIKVSDLPQVQRMRDAIAAHPLARDAFKRGSAEVSYTWPDPDYGFACKARADFVAADLGYIADLKSVPNAHPREWARDAYKKRFWQRAAWYLDGASIVEGTRIDRYWFLNVETDEPHLISICEFPERWLEWGRRVNRKARETFAWCIEHDTAPGYRPHDRRDRDVPFTVDLPSYGEYELTDLDERGEFAVQGKPRTRELELGAMLHAPGGAAEEKGAAP